MGYLYLAFVFGILAWAISVSRRENKVIWFCFYLSCCLAAYTGTMGIVELFFK